jgi:hypothetical protein
MARYKKTGKIGVSEQVKCPVCGKNSQLKNFSRNEPYDISIITFFFGGYKGITSERRVLSHKERTMLVKSILARVKEVAEQLERKLLKESEPISQPTPMLMTVPVMTPARLTMPLLIKR